LPSAWQLTLGARGGRRWVAGGPGQLMSCSVSRGSSSRSWLG